MIQKQKQNNNKIAQLETEITSARNHLQFLWNIKGSTDAEVLGASIEVDMLINEYERLIQGEKPLRVTRKNRKVKESGNWLRV